MGGRYCEAEKRSLIKIIRPRDRRMDMRDWMEVVTDWLLVAC